MTWNGDQMIIDPSAMKSIPMPNGKVKMLAGLLLFDGCYAGRFGEATIGLPGGCNFEPRPIDQHIKGFEALGRRSDAMNMDPYVFAAKELRGAKIYLDVVSVGATINIMLAASRAKGLTIIENAAKSLKL